MQGQVNTPSGEMGDVVLKEQGEINQLVGWALMPAQGYGIGHLTVFVIIERKPMSFSIHKVIVATDIFLGVHDGETGPAIDAFHKFAIQLQVNTGGIGPGRLIGIVTDAHIVDVVWHDVSKVFVTMSAVSSND